MYQDNIALLKAIVEAMPTPVFFKDMAMRYQLVNKAFADFNGVRVSDVIGKTVHECWHQDSAEIFYDRDRDLLATPGVQVYETQMTNARGEVRNVVFHKATVHGADGQCQGIIGVILDITERKQAEEIIHRHANYDPLTHLPNRRLFLDRLAQEIKKARRASLPLALFLIDLDRFKEVNDTLGHQVGDELLVEAARRITANMRQSDTVARLGGDEFTVILPELEDTESVDRIAQDIIRKLAAPFYLGKEKVFISASLGITLYPIDAEDIDSMLKNADQAMYQAKNKGRNGFSYYTAELQAAAQKRMRLTNDVHGALENHEFRVYYQPIVELSSGTIHKAEALVRWQHPERGLVYPAEFIPLAEENGMIVEIGDWVFQQAAEQAKQWRAKFDASFQVSINKSPVQFRQDDSRKIDWASNLNLIGLAGDAVVVDITEGLLLHAEQEVTDKLMKFCDAGIAVAIDDFGTGYSSLSYLKKFDIDFLKIDQTFVQNLDRGTEDGVLCEAMIMMAHKLGLKVIAEGVETEAQRDLLLRAGCDYAQGYLFARPMAAEEFEKRWLGEQMQMRFCGVT